MPGPAARAAYIFINGLFESHRNRAPVILLASQISSELLGNDFPQEVDFLSVYQSCSVFCEQILTADQAPAVIRRACQAALNQRGVAVVVVPVDISKAKNARRHPNDLAAPTSN